MGAEQFLCTPYFPEGSVVCLPLAHQCGQHLGALGGQSMVYESSALEKKKASTWTLLIAEALYTSKALYKTMHCPSGSSSSTHTRNAALNKTMCTHLATATQVREAERREPLRQR